jgi:hypothetical protein
MIYYASSVVRAVERSLVIVDLPFGSYQGNSKEALNSAVRVMKETGAHGVKLEGGREIVESVTRILSAGIPVMGHLGLTPQSIHKFGTFVVRARDSEEAKKLLEDAHILETTGCFSIVLEKIPATGCTSGTGIENSYYRDRCRPVCGWPGACIARHAWDYAGFFTPFPPPLSQPLPGNNQRREQLHHGYQEPGVPE